MKFYSRVLILSITFILASACRVRSLTTLPEGTYRVDAFGCRGEKNFLKWDKDFYSKLSADDGIEYAQIYFDFDELEYVELSLKVSELYLKIKTNSCEVSTKMEVMRNQEGLLSVKPTSAFTFLPKDCQLKTTINEEQDPIVFGPEYFNKDSFMRLYRTSAEVRPIFWDIRTYKDQLYLSYNVQKYFNLEVDEDYLESKKVKKARSSFIPETLVCNEDEFLLWKISKH